MVAVLLVFVVCLAVVLVLRVVLENVKFDLNDKPLCNLAICNVQSSIVTQIVNIICRLAKQCCMLFIM